MRIELHFTIYISENNMVEMFSLAISILDIWLWKVVPSNLFSKLWNGKISTIVNTSSKLVDICSRSSRIRKVLDSEVAIYLFQIFKCFCCWHASLLPKRWEGSKTHHTLLMTLYGGLCNRARLKFEYQIRYSKHSNVDNNFRILKLQSILLLTVLLSLPINDLP